MCTTCHIHIGCFLHIVYGDSQVHSDNITSPTISKDVLLGAKITRKVINCCVDVYVHCCMYNVFYMDFVMSGGHGSCRQCHCLTTIL